MTRDEAQDAIRAALADPDIPAHIRDFVMALARMHPAVAASDAVKIAELFLAAAGGKVRALWSYQERETSETPR